MLRPCCTRLPLALALALAMVERFGRKESRRSAIYRIFRQVQSRQCVVMQITCKPLKKTTSIDKILLGSRRG